MKASGGVISIGESHAHVDLVLPLTKLQSFHAARDVAQSRTSA
jgi:hypothetical protein